METAAITDAGSHTHKNSLFKTNQPRWLKNAPMLIGDTAIVVQGKKYFSLSGMTEHAMASGQKLAGTSCGANANPDAAATAACEMIDGTMNIL